LQAAPALPVREKVTVKFAGRGVPRGTVREVVHTGKPSTSVVGVPYLFTVSSLAEKA